MEKVRVSTKDKIYDIFIESALFSKLSLIFKEKYCGKKLALISDSNVFPLYGDNIERELRQAGFEVVPIVLEAGEKQKNLNTLGMIYTILADNAFTRSDIVVALGGGVIGDIAGLAAATFLRGMGFIQIPTTLLAMVDSSIGGKVAVDLPQGKNLVGAFYQPDAVYTDPGLLDTLADSQFSDGMAELLKHSFIRNPDLYHILVSCIPMNDESIPRKAVTEKLDYIIAESCRIKRDIVEKDERDNGIRQLLNFGHTLGHAIERLQNYSGYSHGQAISIGMASMTKMTEQMGITKKGEANKVIDALALYGLPVAMSGIRQEDLIETIRLDKKARSGKITIAYIEAIGKGKLLELDFKDLEERINGILINPSIAT